MGERELFGLTEQQVFELAEKSMTPKQWLVFWLHHHEGFSQYQIALALGVSRSTVQSRLVQGKARLVAAVKVREAA